MNKKILSVLVCLAMLFSALSVFTYAKVVEVEMDLSGLFDDEPAVEEPKEDEGEDKEEEKEEDDKETSKPSSRPSSGTTSSSKDDKDEDKIDDPNKVGLWIGLVALVIIAIMIPVALYKKDE